MVSLLLHQPPFATNLQTFLPLLYLVAAILLGAVVIVLASRWRQAKAPMCPSASDQLAQYRELYERGEISQEEYLKLRNLLGGEIRKELAVPVRPPGDGAIRKEPEPLTGGEMGPPPGDQPPQTPGIRPA